MPAKKRTSLKRSLGNRAGPDQINDLVPGGGDPGASITAMDGSKVSAPGRRPKKPRLGVGQALFLSASICAISTMAPQIAVAQALPTGCTDTAPDGNGDGTAQANETITCVSATPIGGISTNVDDITVVVGSDTQATTVSNATGDGISLNGDGSQILRIYNADSYVDGSVHGVDAYAYKQNTIEELTIYSEGAITGAITGIYARNYNNGATTITTADVTGSAVNGIDVYSDATTTEVTINTVSGEIFGGDTGISVTHKGAGALSITTADVWGDDDKGIYAITGTGTTNVTIDTTAGYVFGRDTGIDVYHKGSGYLSIKTADVTGYNGHGIDVYADGSVSSVTIDTTASNAAGSNVYGYNTAIKVDHNGSGDVSITTGDVFARNEYGIYLYADNAGANATINTTGGSVRGGSDGIFVLGYNDSGDISITTADVEGNSGHGIRVYNSGYDINEIINTTAGEVIGASDGIYVYHGPLGVGYISITTADVTGKTEDGIFVKAGNEVTDITIDTTAGYVYGKKDAIDVSHQGTGDVSITTGDVYAFNGTGIYLFADNDNADAIINTTAGSVEGFDRGIHVEAYNAGGDISITTADVEGKNSEGIKVYNSGYDINEIINTTAGKVIGGTFGIYLEHGASGVGYISITTADVTGKTEDGIFVKANNAVTDITIDTTAGYVYGRKTGIDVSHVGTGFLSITTADVTGKSDDGIVVQAGNAVTDVTIDTSLGHVYGNKDAIDVSHQGTGALSITTASVWGYNFDGIDVTTGSNVTGVTINTTASNNTGGKVYGYYYGIQVDHNGSGNVSITTADVTGDEKNGIDVDAGVNVADVTIDTAAGYVYGRITGIDVSHAGTGFLSITTADVTGITGNGIDAYGDNSITDMTIDTSAGAVSGATVGIDVNHLGAGILSLTTADVTGTSGIGIYVFGGNATNMTIDTSAGAVSGATTGIKVAHFGTGFLSITTADVTGTSGNGMEVYGGSSTTNMTIDSSAGAVYGGADGINAFHNGSGALSITAADVTGKSFYGVYAYSGANTTGMTVNTAAGSVYGGVDGIFVNNNGAGALSITTADVTGNSRYGIFVDADSSVTDVIIDSTAGAVSGGTFGIEVGAGNSGIVSVTTADVTGNTENGIWINAAATVSDITINSSAGEVNGYNRGISVLHLGDGSLSVTTADVTASAGNGISLNMQSTTTDVTVNTVAGSVYGQGSGISLFSHGDGHVSVTTADVNGIGANGIDVQTSYYVSGVTIDSSAGDVYGQLTGIFALHNGGSGALSITTADVTGKSFYGIYAYSGVNATGMTINTAAGAVYGGVDGIFANHNGAGALSITTADVTGNTGEGIFAYSAASTTSMTIDTAAGAVEGGTDGIIAQQRGSGDIAVTAADVTGNNGVGIHAFHLGGGAVSFNLSGAVYGSDYGIRTYGPGGVSMTLASGASVSSGADAISIFGISNDVLTMEAGSSISGGAFLNDGDDTLNVNGGVFTGIFGGAGTDTANFGATGDDENTLEIASDALQEFEIFNFNAGGYELTGDHTGLTETNFYAGVNVLDGSLTSTDVMIADGATLNARDGAVITGLLSNYGTLDVGSSPGALTVIGDLFLGDTSYLPIEFTATAYDQIIVSGDVELGGTIELIVLDGASLGTTELTVITAEGEITGAVDITTSGLLLASDASIDDAGTGLTVTTTVGLPSQVVPGLTTNQQEIGDHIMLALTGDVTSQDFLLFINGVGSITDEETLAAVLDDLAPESLDIGLKMITESQGQFADLTLDMASRAAAAEDGKPRFWGAVDVFGVNQADSADYLGFDGHVTLYALGVSGVELGPVKLGAGLGFSNFTAGEDAGYGGVVRGDSATGRAVHLNANLHADIPSDLAFGLVGSIDSSFSWSKGENDLEMYTIDPASGAVVTQWTEADISSIDWRTRFSVDGFGNATLPVTPYAVVGLTNYDQEALTIGGSTIVPIDVAGLENLRGLASVGVEYEHWLKKNLRISADLSGTQYFGETQNEFSSRFVGAPDDQDSFLTFGKRVETQVAIKAGVEYHLNSGLMFSAVVGAETGDIEMIGGSLRMSKRF